MKLRTLPVTGLVMMRDILTEEQRRMHITKAVIVTCEGPYRYAKADKAQLLTQMAEICL